MDLTNPKELTVSSFKLYNNRLEAVGTPSFEEWLKCGDFLKNANGAVHFWIGDWLNYGEHKWGEMYSQAMEETGYEYSTLRNDKWVSSRVNPERRRDNLSFSHHKEIADLEPEEQEVMLQLAQEQKLNRNDFSREVRNYRLKLDLPELSAKQLEASSADFEKVDPIVMKLIEVTEDLKGLNVNAINPDARDYLLAQVRKSLGVLANLATKGVNVIE